jgi:periplasmic divalent cation tolerance protein
VATGRTVAWVQTHVGSRKDAMALARAVVKRRLAAVANVWPIESLYWWKGSLVEGREMAVLFKTSEARVDDLVAAVSTRHPYEVAYIAWGRGEKVAPKYAEWVRREAAPRRPRATRRKT